MYYYYDTATWPESATRMLSKRLTAQLNLPLGHSPGDAPYIEVRHNRDLYPVHVAIRRMTHLSEDELNAMKRQADIVHESVCNEFEVE